MSSPRPFTKCTTPASEAFTSPPRLDAVPPLGSRSTYVPSWRSGWGLVLSPGLRILGALPCTCGPYHNARALKAGTKCVYLCNPCI